jgi:RNA-directed DNA polymerase
MAISPEEVIAIAARSPRQYRMYFIGKRNGGRRAIFHPARETKGIQYALMEVFLRYLPVSNIATAYRFGVRSPIRVTAEAHARKRYTVCLDFRRFFPSIVSADLLGAIDDWNVNAAIDVEDKRFLANALFVAFRGDEFLGIGAPSSPMVSNAVMKRLDGKLYGLAVSETDDAILTRYADDLCFSSNVRGSCRRFVQSVTSLLKGEHSPSLELNEKKTKFSSTGASRHVLGLTITPEGKVSIGRERKRQVRALLNRYKYGDLSRDETLHLKGYLAYCQDVEPEFINRLVLKYGAGLLDKIAEETTATYQ